MSAGFCGIDDGLYIASYGLHFGEEPFLTGSRGSGTVFFAGCSLRCRFCQNFQISRWTCTDRNLYRSVIVEDLAGIFFELKEQGAANINLVSPTPYALQAAEAIVLAKKQGLNLPVVWNSHGNDSPATVDVLKDIVDIWLPDMKYGSDSAGLLYSGVNCLYSKGRETLKKIYDAAGPLVLDDEGMAVRGTAVRHLIIPGNTDNSLDVLDFLETVDRNMYLSLMSQFHPLEAGDEIPELNRKLSQQEYDRVLNYAEVLGFVNLMTQELESSDSCVPDFDRKEVFNFDDR